MTIILKKNSKGWIACFSDMKELGWIPLPFTVNASIEYVSRKLAKENPEHDIFEDVGISSPNHSL